jgi:hypothetical protein
MELDSLNKAINKLAPHMLRNIPLEFNVTINKSQFYDFSTYDIIYTFTIDHSKFWQGKSFAGEPNPNFDENYNEIVNQLYFGNYEDKLEEVPKYLGINDYDVRIHYNHINTDTYEPLVTFLKKEYPNSFELLFHQSAPVVMINITDFNEDKDDMYNTIQHEGFNIDDIIIS